MSSTGTQKDEQQAPKKNEKASRNSGARASIGAHGEDVLELLFRIGGCTGEQLERFMVLKWTVARRTLSRLEAHKYVATTHDYARYQEKKALTGEKASGRPAEYFYLTPRGQDYAGQLAGAEDNKEARACYKRHGLPGLAAHSSIENRVLLAVLGAAAKDSGWSVPLSEVGCESGLEYPLETNRKERKGNQLREVEPDGEFQATTPYGRCIYMFEIESGLRGKKLVNKIEDYASWMRRAELVRPVLFVGLSRQQASSMRATAKRSLEASTGEWQKWADLFGRKAKGRDAAEQVSPYHLVGFAALQDVEKAYSEKGLGAAVWQVMDEDRGEPLALSLSELAMLAGEGREMVYGVREVT